MKRRILIILFYFLQIDSSICIEISEKVRKVCGLQETKEDHNDDLFSRLSNGEEFVHGNHPWLTAIVEENSRKRERRFICGGSLITDSHVVTAAHCVHPKDMKIKLPENLIVILGAHNLSDPYEAEKEISKVKSVFIHADYETTTKVHSRFTGDLALITLVKTITFTDYIRPICVVMAHKISETNVDGILVGWGQTLSTENHSDVPYAITIPIIDDGPCYRNDSRLATIAWDKSFCAGSEGKGACKGDSGSGFYVKREDRFFLKGVVSSAINGGGCSGNHLVIFTDVTKYNISEKTSFRHKKFIEKCNEYSELKYGVLLSQRILGGTPTELGEFPHMAAIGFQNSQNPNNTDYVCAGALISERFILTCAHCFGRKDFKATTVKLGRASMIDDEMDQNSSIDIKIKIITIHPEYTRTIKYNDIALIELEQNVLFTKFARPACLFNPENEVVPPFYIAGWGRVDVDSNSVSSWLLKGEVREVNFDQCAHNYNFQLLILPKGLKKASQLCVVGKRGEKIIGSCQGDSGIPLSYKERKPQFYMHHIFGLNSFGVACGIEFGEVFTRVSNYLEWIQSIVWPEDT